MPEESMPEESKSDTRPVVPSAKRSVDRQSIEVATRSGSVALGGSMEPSFPDLLPAPVPPINAPGHLTGRILAGVFGVVVLLAVLVGGVVAGWMLRGDDGVETGATAEVLADLVERVLVSESPSLTADDVRDIFSNDGAPVGLSRGEVEAIVADSIVGAGGLSSDEVASIVSTVVEETAGFDQVEVEAVVARLVEESAGLSAVEVEALVSRLFAEAPVDDSGDEPVVAVADALRHTVVLVSAVGMGQGSGIVFDDTRIVTNAHVVDGADELLVTLPNGREIVAVEVGVDVRRDVAVIELVEEAESLVPAVFAFSEDLKVGQLAVAVGSPFDLQRTVTSGIVSALGRVIDSYGCESGSGADCAGVAMIQTDAPINPGNSGGPLADRQGRVIGMNTSIRSSGAFASGNIGVGFALPSDTVVLVARRLITGQPVGTAWLGIRGESPTDGSFGAVIVEVIEGSPAAASGLMEGDRIFRSDGRIIRDMPALRANIQIRLPGTSVDLEVDREGEILSIEVGLGALDDQFDSPTEDSGGDTKE
ncbi:MAG: trypsin-like peptidase domain-containing protein [Acidimicrobiales bacterium]|nr:trypsin-like peptidase domain-containing protein [Acidimicrobiales bacterium]